MPPSPSLIHSPGRDMKPENHKRVRSFDNGLNIRDKQDDLALFTEMQNRERDNFLLHMPEDLNESLSKLKHFSDFKLGITIPSRGENSDLLNDEEKNDYDWLLTPPETPLFPSLDNEAPSVYEVHRGRPRSQPISISRASNKEKKVMPTRDSASPHRLSPSPRTSSNTFRARGQSCPNPASRSSTPSRKPSTPPNRSSSNIRPRTLTPGRMSTGSSGPPSGKRWTSPANVRRGNSASPKLRGWQSNLTEFLSDAPPNLRTSLLDRPASHSRGVSPSSNNGKNSSLKFGRQSMSPIACRSDRTQSKGSIVSSGDNDIDSPPSVTLGNSSGAVSRKTGALINSKAMAFSKKQLRTPLSSSAPKRSFDSVLRQMDLHKSPQHMFRPLLSSVPSTTLYIGKRNGVIRPILSRNSSITTSSNASSEHGASIALDNERRDHEQVGGWEQRQDHDIQEEIFIFDRVYEVNEDVSHSPFMDKSKSNNEILDKCTLKDAELQESEKTRYILATDISEPSCLPGDPCEVGCVEIIASCSKCGHDFLMTQLMDMVSDTCPTCEEKYGRKQTEVSNHNNTNFPEPSWKENQYSELLTMTISHMDYQLEGVEKQENDGCDNNFIVGSMYEEGWSKQQLKHNSEKQPNHKSKQQQFSGHQETDSGKQENDDRDSNFVVGSMSEEGWSKQQLKHNSEKQPNHRSEQQQFSGHQETDSGKINLLTSEQQSEHLTNLLNTDIHGSKDAGISLLLQRNNSTKWPVVQGRTFSASLIPFDDPSYARLNANSLRGSIGHGRSSVSSSVDLNSSRNSESCQRQTSSKKDDEESPNSEIDNESKSMVCSILERGENWSEILPYTMVTEEEYSGDITNGMEYHNMAQTMSLDGGHYNSSKGEVLHDECSCFIGKTPSEATSLLSTHLESTLSEKTFEYDDFDFSSNEDQDNAKPVHRKEYLAESADPSIAATDVALISDTCNIYVPVASITEPVVSSGLIQYDCCSPTTSQTDLDDCPNRSNMVEALQKAAISIMPEIDVHDSGQGATTLGQIHGSIEESSIIVEGPGECKTINLTFEEATDTILFCSSIIHNLAYQAATIGIEHEDRGKRSSLFESHQPTVRILDNPSSERKKIRNRISSKQSQRLKPPKERWLERDVSHLYANVENKSYQEYKIPDPPDKIENAKPPKLESKCNCSIM